MKRLSLFLVCAIAAFASFHSCSEADRGDLDNQSFILVKDDPEKPIPVLEGQTMEMKIGEMVLPAYYVGGDGWYGLLPEGKCIISDPSVLMYYTGILYALHGGTSSVTLIYQEHEVHFTVNVPEGPSHGTIWFTAYDYNNGKPTEDWEGLIPFSDLLVVNGVLTDQSASLISSDSDDNRWLGVSKGGRIYLSCNGRELGENASIEFPHPELRYFPKKEFVRTRHGYLFYFYGSQYKVISSDGTVREGTVQGSILDMDMNAQGDIYLWTWYSYLGYVWIVSPDGTTTSHEAGADHIIISAGLDVEGNEYFLCRYSEDNFGLYKNGKAIYNLNGAYNPRMIIHGTDVWVATYSPDGDPDAAGNVTDWGLYLVKNSDVTQLGTGIFAPGEIDFCITQSGTPYLLAGNAAGYFVYKSTELALFIPFVNGTNPQLAVID